MKKVRNIITMCCIACAIAAIFVYVIATMESKNKLHVYNWSDYIDPELIAKFEKENNCEVVIDTFDDNETMLAKLMSGASGYDIIFPSSYIIPILVRNNLIKPLDRTKLPNVLNNFDKKFVFLSHRYTLSHSVPYAFSITGIAYRKDKVDPATMKHSWQDLKNSAFQKRVSLFRDMREMIGIGLTANGYSVNTTVESELEKALEYILDIKQYVSKLDNELYRTALVSGELLACTGYNSDVIQVQVDNPDCQIEFFIPEEGSTCCWDEMAITASSKQDELAYKFINFFYDPKNAAANMAYVCSVMPNANMWPYVDNAYKNNELVNINPKVLDKLELIKDVGPNLQKYSRIWDKFMAK